MTTKRCRAFRAQLAEWKQNRLSPEAAAGMADHVRGCADCARAADTEAQMRAFWHSLPSAPTNAAVWDGIARRLEAAPSRRPFPLFAAPRRVWAGAAALAVVIGYGLCAVPRPAAPPPSVLPSVQRTLPPAQYAAWTGLPDVARVDPAVDDPAGAASERVWGVVHAQGSEAR